MSTQELTPKEKQEVQGHEHVQAGKYYVPEVDIFEDQHNLWLTADMPGVDPEHVTVEFHDDTLTLQGNVALDEYRDLSPAYTEYNVGHFLRRFNVPRAQEFDQEKITARVVDGVLEVQLPKAEHTKPRRIPVTVN